MPSPRLVSEDEDRLENNADKSGHCHQQGAAPSRTQAAGKKQERQTESDQPPEIPVPFASAPNPGRSISASFGKNRASQIMTA